MINPINKYSGAIAVCCAMILPVSLLASVISLDPSPHSDVDTYFCTDQGSVTASISNLDTSPPSGTCCNGNASWNFDDKTTYSWSVRSIYAPLTTPTITISLSQPRTEMISATVTHHYKCSDSRDDATTTKKDDPSNYSFSVKKNDTTPQTPNPKNSTSIALTSPPVTDGPIWKRDSSNPLQQKCCEVFATVVPVGAKKVYSADELLTGDCGKKSQKKQASGAKMRASLTMDIETGDNDLGTVTVGVSWSQNPSSSNIYDIDAQSFKKNYIQVFHEEIELDSAQWGANSRYAVQTWLSRDTGRPNPITGVATTFLELVESDTYPLNGNISMDSFVSNSNSYDSTYKAGDCCPNVK